MLSFFRHRSTVCYCCLLHKYTSVNVLVFDPLLTRLAGKWRASDKKSWGTDNFYGERAREQMTSQAVMVQYASYQRKVVTYCMLGRFFNYRGYCRNDNGDCWRVTDSERRIALWNGTNGYYFARENELWEGGGESGRKEKGSDCFMFQWLVGRCHLLPSWVIRHWRVPQVYGETWYVLRLERLVFFN